MLLNAFSCVAAHVRDATGAGDPAVYTGSRERRRMETAGALAAGEPGGFVAAGVAQADADVAVEQALAVVVLGHQQQSVIEAELLAR